MKKPLLIMGNLGILSLVYFFMANNKFGFLNLPLPYVYLYFLILLYNSISSTYYHKYNILLQNSFWLTLRIIFWSNFISGLFIIITVSFTELWTISREFIFLTLFSIFLLEILIAGIIFKFIHKTSHLTSGLAINKNQLIYRYNIKWLIIGAVTLITFYTILLFSRTGQIIISVQDEQNLLLRSKKNE